VPIKTVSEKAHDQVIDGLRCQIDRLADVAMKYLKSTRKRANAGWMPMRCVACNVPHPAGLKECLCPHHDLIELLNELGYEINEVSLYG
jgi:hypothetical protein